jgi:lactate dehydrogenase-like 2-hydroxyacid dehydrogenase
MDRRKPQKSNFLVVTSLVTSKFPIGFQDPWDKNRFAVTGQLVLKINNVLLSAHIGYISDENYQAFYSQTAESVLNFIEGKNVKILGGDKGMFET